MRCTDTHSRNLASNERRSSRSVLLIVPVLRGNDDTVVADVVAFVADDENLGSSDATKCLITVGIAKSDNCCGQPCM